MQVHLTIVSIVRTFTAMAIEAIESIGEPAMLCKDLSILNDRTNKESDPCRNGPSSWGSCLK
jgi:hypothetical protein